MLRSLMTLIVMPLTFFPATGLAEEVASAFRYPITTNGLNQGSSYTISQGYRNSAGHDGIDFAYSCGDPIYAVADGMVVHSADSGDWGNLVRIRHLMPDGSYRYSQYAHQQDRYVSYGETVTYGQQIGIVGTTGKSTGCHLHFQIITTNMSGCGYYPSSTCGLDWSEDQYWSTFIDPITFLDDRLGEAETSTTSSTLFTTALTTNFVTYNKHNLRKKTVNGVTTKESPAIHLTTAANDVHWWGYTGSGTPSTTTYCRDCRPGNYEFTTVAMQNYSGSCSCGNPIFII